MPKLRFMILAGFILAQVASGSLIASVAMSDVVTAASPPASHTIQVGPGFSDVSPHQIVRTTANILYAFAPTCDSYPSCPGNTLRVYRADRPGTPVSFAEQDSPHRPAAVGAVAVGLDGSDTIHAVWNDRAGNVNYATFATTTNTWGPITTLAATAWTDFGQGDEGVALALDSSGIPHAVWSAKTPDGVLHLFYANRAANWVAQQIDDVPLTGNRRAMHPALAFRPDGTLLLAWLEGTFNYVPDGAIHTRARSSLGTWGTTQTVADPDGVMTTIDNGPSLIVTPDGTAHLTFVAATPPDQVRYWYDSGTGWRGDQQPPAQVTHDPALGPDGSGGIFIYGHGTPAPTYQDHGDNLYAFHRPAGSGWGPWTLYATGSFDSSVSTRWAQFFHPFPTTLDLAYWADAYPNTLYIGSDPPSTSAPPTPTNVHKTGATVSSLSFAWDPVGPATYLVVGDGTTITPLPVPGTTSYTEPTAVGGWACLSVVAATAGGFSSWSPWACGFARPPAPVIAYQSHTTSSVTFSWMALPSWTAIGISNGAVVTNLYGVTTYTQGGMTAGQWACVSGLAYNPQEHSVYSSAQLWTPWVCGQAG